VLRMRHRRGWLIARRRRSRTADKRARRLRRGGRRRRSSGGRPRRMRFVRDVIEVVARLHLAPHVEEAGVVRLAMTSRMEASSSKRARWRSLPIHALVSRSWSATKSSRSCRRARGRWARGGRRRCSGSTTRAAGTWRARAGGRRGSRRCGVAAHVLAERLEVHRDEHRWIGVCARASSRTSPREAGAPPKTCSRTDNRRRR